MTLVWVTNSRDYRRAKYRMELPIIDSTHYRTRSDGLVDIIPGPMTRAEWDGWIADKVVGPPRGTRAYRSGQLSDMGIIGIYREMTWGQAIRKTLRRVWAGLVKGLAG
jgi:hypothetical protein